ncbi:MAG: hypothetical protein GDA53_06115 [Rhodobacteraceae bacterium]|nr:hypothetical protein [Paracoccaceae bacterium]
MTHEKDQPDVEPADESPDKSEDELEYASKMKSAERTSRILVTPMPMGFGMFGF